MLEPPDMTPIQSAWWRFIDSSRVILVLQPDARPLDQYLQFRDTALALAQSPDFLAGLQQSWSSFQDVPRVEVGNALLMELEAFPRAVEVANTTAASESEKKVWFRILLGKASTVAGSVDDIMENLPPLVKGGIKLVREVMDLFKGKD
jgi:hypothetical protein